MKNKSLFPSQELEKLTEKIKSLKKDGITFLVAIDGHGGCGKSSLAEELKNNLENVTIVRMDDFGYPDTDKNRLLEQVILPISIEKKARYQLLDWNTKKLSNWYEVIPDGIIIIEGVFALDNLFYRYYDYKIWIDCPSQIGSRRGIKRDKDLYKINTEKEWKNNWIPAEKKYIRLQNPQKKADFILREVNN